MIVVCTSISDDFMAVRTRVGLGSHVFGLDVVLDIGGLGLVSTGKTLPPAPAKIGHQRLYTLQLCKSTAHSTFSSLKKSLCMNMYLYLYISFSQNQLSIQQVIIIHAACNYFLTHLTNLCCDKVPLFFRIVITTQALDTILSIKYHIITLKSLFFLCLRLRCVLSMCLVLRKSPHSGHLCPALSTCLASMWYLTLVDLDS